MKLYIAMADQNEYIVKVTREKYEKFMMDIRNYTFVELENTVYNVRHIVTMTLVEASAP